MTSNPESRAQMGNQVPTNGPGVQTRNLGSNHGPGIQIGSSSSSCGPAVQLGNPGSNHGPRVQTGNSAPSHQAGVQIGSSGFNQGTSNSLDSRNSLAKPISAEKPSMKEDSFDFDFHDESFSQIDPIELVRPNPGPSGNAHQNQNAPAACTAFGLNQRGETPIEVTIRRQFKCLPHLLQLQNWQPQTHPALLVLPPSIAETHPRKVNHLAIFLILKGSEGSSFCQL
ncbi:hypothetical protein DSO57_1038673 [Entomophthora muscae]|uniref:Uncharacterized protein n=1 Tax=Entomophthora muscae TaxID=34485 RepID=A0ACC2SN93_9FUNG|nr:hypothetical protein DSO57_1038673 [Entomophthora muscae]